jgi:tRNA A-37 threonylcarbamoyl transferase component Bud32
MTRFERLRRQLSEWNNEAIPMPLVAWVDPSGRPSVLSEFRQGVPIVERLESGGLNPIDAEKCLTSLLAATRSAHGRGLVHGSIVSGNIIVAARCHPAYLLDFGHAALVAAEGDDLPAPSDDYAGFARLIHIVCTQTTTGPRRL